MSTQALTERSSNPRLFPAADVLKRIADHRLVPLPAVARDALERLEQEAWRIRELEACLLEAQRFTKHRRHETWFLRADRALGLRP